MTRSNESTFPYQFEDAVGVTTNAKGLTKREYFAALALQGLMSSVRWAEDNNSGIYDYHAPSARVLASVAVHQADALISALNGQ